MKSHYTLWIQIMNVKSAVLCRMQVIWHTRWCHSVSCQCAADGPRRVWPIFRHSTQRSKLRSNWFETYRWKWHSKNKQIWAGKQYSLETGSCCWQSQNVFRHSFAYTESCRGPIFNKFVTRVHTMWCGLIHRIRSFIATDSWIMILCVAKIWELRTCVCRQ